MLGNGAPRPARIFSSFHVQNGSCLRPVWPAQRRKHPRAAGRAANPSRQPSLVPPSHPKFPNVVTIEMVLVGGCILTAVGIFGGIFFALKKPKAPPADLSKYEAQNPPGTRFGPPAAWDNSPRSEPQQEMPPDLKEWMRRHQPPKR